MFLWDYFRDECTFRLYLGRREAVHVHMCTCRSQDNLKELHLSIRLTSLDLVAILVVHWALSPAQSVCVWEWGLTVSVLVPFVGFLNSWLICLFLSLGSHRHLLELFSGFMILLPFQLLLCSLWVNQSLWSHFLWKSCICMLHICFFRVILMLYTSFALFLWFPLKTFYIQGFRILESRRQF